MSKKKGAKVKTILTESAKKFVTPLSIASLSQEKVYEDLFVKNLSEDEVAKKLGYTTNEKNRKAGYKQIKNLKKMFKEKAVVVIQQKDIIIINDQSN